MANEGSASQLLQVTGDVAGIKGEMGALATKEDVAGIRARMDALASKEEVADIRARMDSFATTEDLANTKIWMVMTWGSAGLIVAAAVIGAIIRFWPTG